MAKDRYISGDTYTYHHNKGQQDRSEGTYSRPSKVTHVFSRTEREANEAYDKGWKSADEDVDDDE